MYLLKLIATYHIRSRVSFALRLSSGAGEMAQQLRALTALPEVLSSNPSNHIVAHNHP